MRLSELLSSVSLEARRTGPDGDPDVERVAYRSDRAGPRSLFACLPGQRADGHEFAADAVARGASALVVERPLPLRVPQVVVADARVAMGRFAAVLAGDPSAALAVVGITGTNGKTTSAFLLQSVLAACGLPCGLLGTVEARIGGVVEPVVHTTPESADLQPVLRRMVEAGDRACAMEVSSHALTLRRVAGVRFSAALFTNLTRDHLDYHADIEAYFAAKRALFRRPDGDGPDPPGAANVDDPFGRRLVEEAALVGFAVDREADVCPVRVTWHAHGVHGEFSTPRGRLSVESELRGRFNASNIAGVIATAEVLGLPHDGVARGIAELRGVPGRLEPIDEGQPFQVLVDYAHTPDSLQNALQTVRELVGAGRVLVVFGCGGDRDRGKRPLMGEVAHALADVTIVTSDNPRSEDPDAIIAEILGPIDADAARVLAEPDRRSAIATAFVLADTGDIVLIAGKGHERGQERNGIVAPFDDRDVARDLIRERGGTAS